MTTLVRADNERVGRLDRTGTRYGRLVALHPTGGVRNRSAVWLLLCDPRLGGCGAEVEKVGRHLTTGHTRSCGCLRLHETVKRSTTHGHNRVGQRTPENHAYHNARQRCTNPNNTYWADYGGRGIEFRFGSFAEFLSEVGPKPSPELTLDRVDNEGHYEAGNIKWSTRSEQALNRRPKATAKGTPRKSPKPR